MVERRVMALRRPRGVASGLQGCGVHRIARRALLILQHELGIGEEAAHGGAGLVGPRRSARVNGFKERGRLTSPDCGNRPIVERGAQDAQRMIQVLPARLAREPLKRNRQIGLNPSLKLNVAASGAMGLGRAAFGC